MTDLWRRSRIIAVVGIVGLALGAAACGGSSKSGSKDKTSAECEPFKKSYGLTGAVINYEPSLRVASSSSFDVFMTSTLF